MSVGQIVPLDDVISPYEQWRHDVSIALDRAALYRERNLFDDCGKYFGNFDVLICESDVQHSPKAIPFTCHLRFCPDCEHREQARKLARYIPAFEDLATEGRADFSLKKFELTTPYALYDPACPTLLKQAWSWVEQTLQLMFYNLLQHELSPEEKKRHRIDYKAHGLGLFVACEFGERGKKLHFHILAYAPYMPKRMLTETWQDVTGGECEITWIKAVRFDGVEAAVSEVAKYVTKFSQLTPSLIPNLIRALAGTRRVRTYGVIRDSVIPDRECNCSTCSSALILISASEYIERCFALSISADEQISRIIAGLGLEFKHGNKSGVTESAEKAGLVGIPPPDTPDQPVQTHLPGLQGLKTLNSYDF